MEKLSILHKVHKKVFKSFEYKTDLEQYGRLEKWVMPSSSGPVTGDCEDFALACRVLLREQGIENSRLVYCLTERSEGHLVLECEGYILDNRQKKVVMKQKLSRQGYKWLSISGYNPGDAWHEL